MNIESAFLGVPIVALSTFPAPPCTRIPRKKGQLPAFPSILVAVDGKNITVSSVDPARQIYLPIYSRSDWGRQGSVKYLLKPDCELEAYHWNCLWQHAEVVKKTLKDFNLKVPVLIRRGDAKRCHFDKRPDWTPFQIHASQELLKKDNLDALADEVDGHKPIVDLRLENDPDSVVESLVTMKQFQPTIFKKIEPLLEKHGLLDEVEVIHKRSWKAKDKFYRSDTEPQVLTSYKEIAGLLHIPVDTPAFKSATLSLDTKFKSCGIDYGTMVRVGKVSTDALTNLLDEMIL